MAFIIILLLIILNGYFSLAIAPSLHLFERILYPFIKLLTLSTRFILSAFSIKAANHEKITEKDLIRIFPFIKKNRPIACLSYLPAKATG